MLLSAEWRKLPLSSDGTWKTVGRHERPFRARSGLGGSLQKLRATHTRQRLVDVQLDGFSNGTKLLPGRNSLAPRSRWLHSPHMEHGWRVRRAFHPAGWIRPSRDVLARRLPSCTFLEESCRLSVSSTWQQGLVLAEPTASAACKVPLAWTRHEAETVGNGRHQRVYLLTRPAVSVGVAKQCDCSYNVCPPLPAAL